MDAGRKRAYRYLLYRAMREIRSNGCQSAPRARTWNPLSWWGGSRRVSPSRVLEYHGMLADWLHNLAVFSALDFRNFDEEWFWQGFARLRADFPEFESLVAYYRGTFEREVARHEATDQQTNSEPTMDDRLTSENALAALA